MLITDLMKWIWIFKQPLWTYFVLWSINVLGQLATFHSSPLRQAVAPSLSCFFLTPLPPATLLYLLICLSTKAPLSVISHFLSSLPTLLFAEKSYNSQPLFSPLHFHCFPSHCLFFAYCAGHFVCLWHCLLISSVLDTHSLGHYKSLFLTSVTHNIINSLSCLASSASLFALLRLTSTVTAIYSCGAGLEAEGAKNCWNILNTSAQTSK